jgi:arylsulfate sulfotransferase
MRNFLILIVLAGLAGCGDHGGNNGAGGAPPMPQVAKASFSAGDIKWDGSEPGITPFVSIVHLVGHDLAAVRAVSYVVEPKPDSVSKPVRVTFSRAALEARGQLGTDRLLLPVFGLYAGFENEVSIELDFDDLSTQFVAGTLTTAAYTGANADYEDPVSKQGFDFVALRSGPGTPVIVDTDGAIRWVGVSGASKIFSVFRGCDSGRDAMPIPLEDMRLL